MFVSLVIKRPIERWILGAYAEWVHGWGFIIIVVIFFFFWKVIIII